MSSEDLTKTVVLKRSAKKKSGYTIVEKDGEYFVEAVPAKARVNEGDKVVGINGIVSDEFVDVDDANDLIESIRIVVVPEDQIADYEAAKEAEEAGEAKGEESSDEEFEEVERPRGGSKAKKAAPVSESALVVRDNNDEGGELYPCAECVNDNVNAERDEDGDLVCEECGAIIEVSQGYSFDCILCHLTSTLSLYTSFDFRRIRQHVRRNFKQCTTMWQKQQLIGKLLGLMESQKPMLRERNLPLQICLVLVT